MPYITLEKLLFSQGFGTRRFCRDLILSEKVLINDKTIVDKDFLFDTEKDTFSVDGQSWTYHEKLYIMMNKPKGYECSNKPSHHESLMTLLPVQYVNRNIQCVGRLDVDTTGLILLTDDGQFIHQMTSPKKEVEKLYRVESASHLEKEQIQQLINGVLLRGEKSLTKAKTVQQLDENTLLLGITSGKYHQVKRMLGAIGNAVNQLHREKIGPLVLDKSLSKGQWRHLSYEEKQAFMLKNG